MAPFRARFRRLVYCATGSAILLLSVSACQPLPEKPKSQSVVLEPVADLVYELLQGEIYGYRGDLPRAFEHYYQASMKTEDPDIAYRAIEIALWIGDFESAHKAAMRWHELLPEDPRPWRVLGAIYAGQGRADAAVEAYVSAIEMRETRLGPSIVAVANSLSVRAAQPHRLDIFRGLLQHYPDDPHARLHRALAAKESGLLEEALEGIRGTLELRPQWSRTVAMQVEILTQLSRQDEAITVLKRALRHPADDPVNLRQLLVNLLSADGHYQEALDALSSLLVADPDNPHWQMKRGTLAMALQDWKQSQEAFLDLRENTRLLVPNQPKSFNRSVSAYYLGILEEQDEHIGRAMDYYYQVEELDYLEVDDYYRKARIRIAHLLWGQDQLNEARQHLQVSRALSQDGENIIHLYVAEADMLYSEGQYDQGYALLSEGLKRYPKDSILLYSRALQAERLGRIDWLESDLQAVLAEDPDHPRALNALGYTWVDHKLKLELGMEYIQRAHAQLPNDAAIIDSLGWAHYRLGNLERAEELLRQAQSMLPEGEVTAHLVEVLWKLGRHEEARSLYREAINEQPDNEFLVRVARRFPL